MLRSMATTYVRIFVDEFVIVGDLIVVSIIFREVGCGGVLPRFGAFVFRSDCEWAKGVNLMSEGSSLSSSSACVSLDALNSGISRALFDAKVV